MFLLYINDIVNVSNFFTTSLFADDTSLVCSGNNVNDLIAQANLELENIVEWLACNKLSLNVNKSKYMVFCKRKLININDLLIDGNTIEMVKYFKFLGVVIDDKLCWKQHISFIKKKISRGIGIICKARQVLNKTSLINLYYSFVYPYICYGIEVWGMAYNSNILPLTTLQKKIVRIITCSKPYTSTDPIFLSLGILKIQQIYIVKVQTYMYNFVNGKLPDFFNDMFTLNNSIHRHGTRQSNKLHLPRCRTDLSLTFFKYVSVKQFNDLCTKIDYTKKCLKKLLLFFLVNHV